MKIEVKNVGFTYKEKDFTKKIFSDVSAEFESGKFYAITGASGSGKTTFLALLNKIFKPETGEILVDGEPLNNIPSTIHRTKNVTTIYQTYNLIDYLTAYENIEIALDIQKSHLDDRKEYIHKVLERVGLRPFDIDVSVEYLSGGEQQRVAIARALVTNAKFILADEPTGNLDQTLSKNIFEMLKRLACEKGLGVILVTHSQEALKHAEIIYELSEGKLVRRR